MALLSGRKRAFSYRHVERFLSEVAQAGGAEMLTNALAVWTTRLWQEPEPTPDEPPLAFYVDGHKKPVYTNHLIPRGLVGRTGKVLGCRALLLLHDADGHPLLATTHRGDLHLTKGVPALLTRYEQAAPSRCAARLVVDREGLAAEFLATLAAEGRTVVTILRANQYQGLASFTEVGAFVPLSRDHSGQVTQEVAPARFALPLPDQPDHTLPLRVALIRDLSTQVPVVPSPSAEAAEQRWDADLERGNTCWWKPGWVATPAPAVLTEPKLIPIVTTASSLDVRGLVHIYTHRWPAQENVLRDFLLSLGLDTNHGYVKHPVVNSEAAKSRSTLERKLARVQRVAQQARERLQRALECARRLEQQIKAKRAKATQRITEHLHEWEQQGMWSFLLREKREEMKQEAAAALAPFQERKEQADARFRAAFDTCERACRQERDLLRQLEELAAKERAMYELENSKDQCMTVLKLALANLGMWVRERWFPAAYAQATWHRLAPFFRLSGRVTQRKETVWVALQPFNDRQLNRDLLAVCARVEAAQPHLPDGRRLCFFIEGTRSLSAEKEHLNVA